MREAGPDCTLEQRGMEVSEAGNKAKSSEGCGRGKEIVTVALFFLAAADKGRRMCKSAVSKAW